ncbi:hypothetical protein EES45_23185 [Streptomyces sp. ADI97-07]|uniref:hypothetical protein n=1 Tax=Streptomyces sp. ADI97-07 TaxID=1522762 RepID=UPI000FAFB446|nr:hypothetical protein [Streptomyces sp. ADI97-07]RPK76399.1 hypothetical protein EES45_23185 [Streptomyces sp. ADI97-07]
MPDDTTISAPIPVRTRPIPGGTRLMLDAFAQSVIEDVLGALLSTDPKSDLYERLVALAEMSPDERRMLPEQRLPFEELVADLASVSSRWTHLYAERGLDLAEQLMVNGAQSLPVGHWGKDAWEAWASVKADAAADARKSGGAAA